MAHKTAKKGPHRVTTASKPKNDLELERQEFEADVDDFISRVHGTIQDARMNMSDEDVARADKAADEILNAASDAAKRSQRGA